MAYSKEVLSRARHRLESQKADRESENNRRLQAVYHQLPRIKEIDLLLRRSMVMAAQTVFSSGIDAAATMEEARQANLALQAERQALLDAHFPPNYLDESPICPRCGGSGYVGSSMCTCLAELCRQEQKKELSLLSHCDGRFESFRLDYYSERIDPDFRVSPRQVMEKTLESCRRYAYGFGPGSGNLLFTGKPGLGKTCLSACIANVVADRGYSVAYESAGNLFSKLEKDRFHPDEESRAAVANLQSCDLLILDDLGTELTGAFVVSALYNLINDRILADKAMVISTNLTVEELSRRYSPQIASRLIGSFQTRMFLGEDIRILRNRGEL